MHINKCPVLAPAATLTPERADELGINRAPVPQEPGSAAAPTRGAGKLVEVFNQEFAGSTDSDPDTQLYAGFFGHGDKSTIDLVRTTPADLLGAGVCLHGSPSARDAVPLPRPQLAPTP